MGKFKSLAAALKDRFGAALSELPKGLRTRVETEIFPLRWDELSAEQRRSWAMQWDSWHDPERQEERASWWKFFQRMDVVRSEIEAWEGTATPTATDREKKEKRLGELRLQLGELDRRIRESADAPPIIGDRLPVDGSIPEGRPEYIAYPKAAALLAGRLGATPEEIAGWIWCGPEQGGLRAFRNAHEFTEPPRFHFIDGMGPNYCAAMMRCWFLASEVAAFVPGERILNGKALVERWGRIPRLQPEAFIRAKIAESRLLDFHPTMGGTRAGSPEVAELPPLEEALFFLRHVEAIEAEDFPGGAALPAEKDRSMASVPEVGSPEWRSANARKGGLARHAKDAEKLQNAKDEIRQLWASGKYSSRDRCAEQEYEALGISLSTARKALMNQPEPARKPFNN